MVFVYALVAYVAHREELELIIDCNFRMIWTLSVLVKAFIAFSAYK